jgi:hypothetical protein
MSVTTILEARIPDNELRKVKSRLHIIFHE